LIPPYKNYAPPAENNLADEIGDTNLTVLKGEIC
jgi:hypothetical protein